MKERRGEQMGGGGVYGERKLKREKGEGEER